MTQTIQDMAFERALRMLDATGAQYAVVYNGETYGTLELAPPPKVRRRGPGPYPRGVTRAHFLPYIGELQPGETAQIPYADFDVNILQSNVSAFCSTQWGTGSAMVRRFEDEGELHILRFF